MQKKPVIYAVIVAGGKGSRMNAGLPKQFLPLKGVPVLTRTLQVFDRHTAVDHTVLVVAQNDMPYCMDYVLKPFGLSDRVHLVAGGPQRADSVLNGLRFIKTRWESAESENTVQSGRPEQCESIVMIHDGVRPLVPSGLLDRGIDTVQKTGAAIPVVSIADTVKKRIVENDPAVKGGTDRVEIETVDRSGLFLAQTPQVFRFDLIFNAFFHPAVKAGRVTDDASVAEISGHTVLFFEGSKFNIKITEPEDLVIAELFLNER